MYIAGASAVREDLLLPTIVTTMLASRKAMLDSCESTVLQNEGAESERESERAIPSIEQRYVTVEPGAGEDSTRVRPGPYRRRPPPVKVTGRYEEVEIARTICGQSIVRLPIPPRVT